MKRSLGSSLTEATLVVLAVIASIAVAAVFDGSKRARGTEARRVGTQGNIKTINSMLVMYKAVNGDFPTAEQGLKALVTRPTIGPEPPNWTQILTDTTALLDPWANELRYERPAKRSNQGFDLYSAGPNGQPGDADDIGNW